MLSEFVSLALFLYSKCKASNSYFPEVLSEYRTLIFCPLSYMNNVETDNRMVVWFSGSF